MDVLATARDMLRKVQIVEELIEISQAFDEREVANIALCAHGLRSVFAMEQHVYRTKEQNGSIEHRESQEVPVGQLRQRSSRGCCTTCGGVAGLS